MIQTVVCKESLLYHNYVFTAFFVYSVFHFRLSSIFCGVRHFGVRHFVFFWNVLGDILLNMASLVCKLHIVCNHVALLNQ
jgi:hypothetical protein